jgi:succinyl-diaminopimelate desuccinylase
MVWSEPGLVGQVDAAVEAVRDEMVEFLAELVRFPTVNPPGAAYRECAEWLAAAYMRFGYEVQLVEADGLPEHTRQYPRVNVLARRGKGNPSLHFNGHFDVVPPGDGWSVPPFAGMIREGRLFGRGTADQKAGLAASLFAVEALQRAGIRLDGTVEQSATVDEESGGFAGVALLCKLGLIAANRTNFVVISEPLGHDRICLGHRGVYWFEVIAHGRTAHGSMPSLGLNAVDLMAGFITTLNRELKPRLASRITNMPVEPPIARHPSLNLNSLHGGQLAEGLESPCVPDRCRAVFDRRFIVEESFDDVRAEIQNLVKAADAEGQRFELRDLMVVEPVQVSADARLVKALSAAIEQVAGRPPTLIASPGTYDQKHVMRLGGVEQCVAYGPGILELAHQPDEYVEIAHLVHSTKVMALAAVSLLGQEYAEARRGNA